MRRASSARRRSGSLPAPARLPCLRPTVLLSFASYSVSFSRLRTSVLMARVVRSLSAGVASSPQAMRSSIALNFLSIALNNLSTKELRGTGRSPSRFGTCLALRLRVALPIADAPSCRRGPRRADTGLAGQACRRAIALIDWCATANRRAMEPSGSSLSRHKRAISPHVASSSDMRIHSSGDDLNIGGEFGAIELRPLSRCSEKLPQQRRGVNAYIIMNIALYSKHPPWRVAILAVKHITIIQTKACEDNYSG